MTSTPAEPMRLVSGGDVCRAAQAILETHLPGVLAEYGLTGLGKVSTWQQVPTVEALTSAVLPAGAITSPGLVEPPRLTRSGGWTATWRLAVGVYARGRDHNETAQHVRDWAAAVRATLLRHPSLGGVVQSLMWAGEDYATLPQRSAARTIGGCAVAFDVTVKDVVQLAPPAPAVAATSSTLSVR